jgi:hypothetical protein
VQPPGSFVDALSSPAVSAGETTSPPHFRWHRPPAATVAEPSAPLQHRDLTEEMTDAEQDVLAVEVDVDLAASDETDRMSLVAATNRSRYRGGEPVLKMQSG